MSLIDKKDINVLLHAGFDENELGLVSGGALGIELFESPDSYFAHELIENACEKGECSLYDEILPPAEKKEPYDHSHPWLWEDQEYAGNEDPIEDVDPTLRPQIRWMIGDKNTGQPGIKIGKMTIWQKKEENGNFAWPVERIHIVIPEDEKERMKTMEAADRKELWIKYAKEEWGKCWQAAVDSLWDFEIEETRTFKTKKGKQLNILVIDADNIRATGYKNLPFEANYITMVYFDKDRR